MTRHSLRALPARRGFTLIELLIVMTMLAVIGAAIVGALNGQQRFVRAATDVGNMQSQLQTAAAILPADLRSISASGGDIIKMTDSSLHVRTTIVSSVVCSVAGNVVTLAPDSPLRSPANATTVNVKVTSVMVAPMLTDSIFIWEPNSSRWADGASAKPFGITSVAAGTCASLNGQPFVSSTPAFQLTLGTPPTGVVPGTAVRIVRHVRYALYQSSVDNQWYLGYYDPQLSSTVTYNYVAGPFRRHSTIADSSGLRFTYFDTARVEITDYSQVNRVARIVATARTRTAAPSSLGGTSKGKLQDDWLRFSVSIRNRN